MALLGGWPLSTSHGATKANLLDFAEKMVHGLYPTTSSVLSLFVHDASLVDKIAPGAQLTTKTPAAPLFTMWDRPRGCGIGSYQEPGTGTEGWRHNQL